MDTETKVSNSGGQNEQTRIGTYVVLGKLGEGGMGTVYKAHDPALDRAVALKLLPPHLASDPAFVTRFKREATAAAKLSHGNLVHVYAVGEEAGAHYIAMELVEGETLLSHIRKQGVLSVEEALAIAIYAAEALRYAWNKAKIIHRDIKPENILLSNDGEVKIADLGLAKSLSTAGVTTTNTGVVMGSPHYISPEQARGDKDIDFRTDIYSLGCTLFQMLSGRTPYDGDEMMPLLLKHVNEPPPDLLQVRPECPPRIAAFLKRMMAKDRTQRPSSYDELITQLTALHNKSQQGVAPSAKPRQRMLLFTGASVLVAAVVIGLLVWSPWKHRSSSRAKPEQDTFIREMAALSAEEQVARVVTELKKLNPGFDGQVTPTIEDGKVVGLAFSTKNVADISPVRALSNLRTLICTKLGKTSEQFGKGKLKDLSPIKSLKLTRLDCSGNPVSDLSPLAEMPLANLKCRETDVVDLSPLRNVPLDSLSVISCPVSDLSPLKGTPMQVLSMQKTKVDNLSPLAGMQLSHVFASECPISDLSPLRGMRLRRLYMPGSPVTDWSVVKEMPLKDIGGDFKAERDTEILRSITTLETINNLPVTEFWKQAATGKMPRPLASKDETEPETETISLATPKAGEVYTNAVGAEMVYIPPGEFMLGSTKEEQDWANSDKRIKDVECEGEAPRKAAIKQGFWMARTEVTVGQWKQFIKETGYVTDAEKKGESLVPQVGGGSWVAKKGVSWRDPDFGVQAQDNHPVCCVSWNDAMAFCEWLEAQEKRSGRLPANCSLRLPTEAEWEYACRAGTQTKFWWGESQRDGAGRLNLTGETDGGRFVTPVDNFGARGRNGFGLADMLGNVYEWCLDGGDPTRAHEDLWTGNSSVRALRGGSFRNPLNTNRCAHRHRVAADYSASCAGFRVMMGRTLTSTKTLAPSASVTPTAKEGGILAPPETRVAALTTPPKAGEVFTLSVGSGVTMELVLIRPGTFTMGSDACSNATPHKVTITKPFYLGKFEVTQEQWQAVTGSNPSNFKGTKQPVESVSWEDCRIFLRELQTKLPGQKFRLPTEAEWEYACRAGSTTTYCYGDDDIRLGGYAWYDQNSDNTAHPVGEKKPNAWGLHDMHGNVREWCADWYGDYPNGEATDPTGPGSGSIRVLRGGPWNGVPGTCRSANRLRESPGRRFTNVGFRLCLDFP